MGWPLLTSSKTDQSCRLKIDWSVDLFTSWVHNLLKWRKNCGPPESDSLIPLHLKHQRNRFENRSIIGVSTLQEFFGHTILGLYNVSSSPRNTIAPTAGRKENAVGERRVAHEGFIICLIHERTGFILFFNLCWRMNQERTLMRQTLTDQDLIGSQVTALG